MARALRTAHFGRGKALAIHLQTFGLLACAAYLLLLNSRGRINLLSSPNHLTLKRYLGVG